eukprot:TRINITY_DN6363_c2_g1_i1.p1 TRINITY_DN6363_c2_g1~~TRINITY_DN6363_c2_g1_i1.p1  ORF type:complete len:386 (-),score=93.65 TRINITY_DN6363_c2_g1_i1:82-1239(-)
MAGDSAAAAGANVIDANTAEIDTNKNATMKKRSSSPAARAPPAKVGADSTQVTAGKQEATAGSLSSRLQNLQGPCSAVLYILVSLAMTTLTKHASSVWKFPGSSFLLLIECIATVVVMALAAPRDRPYKPFSKEVLRHLPLVTLSKALNMYLSFVAMKRTSLPVYNVLKRLQPVYAVLQDYLIRGVSVTGTEMFGVSLICLGTVATGSGDLDFDLIGYVIALSAAACQSLYLVLARRAQDEVPSLSHVDLLFYTAFFNVALFLPLSMAESKDIINFLSADGEILRLAYFIVPYVVLGALLNYATFWCTAATSPLATAVAGSAKGLLSTAVGVVVFGAQLTGFGWLGLAGSTLGGFAYSYAAAEASKHRKKQKAEDDEKAKGIKNN